MRKIKFKRNPLFVNRLGAQIEGRVSGREQWLVNGRLYQIHVKWRDVESQAGVYDWSKYDQDFALLQNYPVIVGVKVVPEWGRVWPEVVGSPPKESAFTALAAFICALKSRYPQIVAVELFNEPDVAPDEFGEYRGAWVLNGDYFGAGQRYGAMCKAIYKMVKQAHPHLVLLTGALLGEATSFDFLRGAIKAGLKADAVSFHAYVRDYAPKPDWNYPKKFAKQLKKITKLPLVITEIALLAKVDSPEFRKRQADFLLHLLDNFEQLNVDALLWYSLADNIWEWSNLVEHGTAQPAYAVFQRGIVEKKKKQLKNKFVRIRQDRD